MTSKLLHESSKDLKRAGSVWEATLITPGQGSSGFYSEDVLRAFAGVAFPAGTKHWFNHPEWEGEQRDKRDQWGYLTEDAAYVEGRGIVGKIKVLKHWNDVVESLAEDGQADLSIWALGLHDEDGNLTAFLPDVTNSVDLVSYPGRPGSGINTKIEAARRAARKPAAEASAEEKEGNMDKEILEALVALKESLTPLVAFVTESQTAAIARAQAEAQDTAAESVDAAVDAALVTYDEKLAAIEAAELLAPQVADLRAQAREGKDVTSAIESAKAVVEAAKQLGEGAPHGRFGGASTKTASDLIPKGW